MNTVADTVVMIRPATFCSNPETRESNSFQKAPQQADGSLVTKAAQEEFDRFRANLQNNEITVLSFDESPTHLTPDALFPNNWFCHLPDNRLFVFPMYPPNRRAEVRFDILSSLGAKEIIDLRYLEKDQQFLEGTGSLILDHRNKMAYACRSVRTSEIAAREFERFSGYRVFLFSARDESGNEIYHTNVMMALSPRHAVVALDCITDENEKNELVRLLARGGRELLPISAREMNDFSGNMLFLQNAAGRHFWIASTKARSALRPELRERLEKEASFIHNDLNTIETHGGGGARCLLAEIFKS